MDGCKLAISCTAFQRECRGMSGRNFWRLLARFLGLSPPSTFKGFGSKYFFPERASAQGSRLVVLLCRGSTLERRRILFVVNLRVFCVLAYEKSTIYSPKNGILALWAMSGVANSLCFYVFSVIQALMERRFTRKNTAVLVGFMFN